MANAVIVTIVDRLDELAKDNPCLTFIKCSLINQPIKEAASSTKAKLEWSLLLDDNYAIAFFEGLVNFDD